MSDHLDLCAAETAAMEPTDWERWASALKNFVGHDLDGDQTEDGYSYDGFYDMWKEGLTPAAAALRAFPARRAELARYEDAECKYVRAAKSIEAIATAMAAGKYFGNEIARLRHHVEIAADARDVLRAPAAISATGSSSTE